MDAVRPHDLHRHLTEQLPVPGAEDFITGAAAEVVDHDQGSVDLLARGESPAFLGGRYCLCHSVTLRASDGCTQCAPHEKRGLPVREPSCCGGRFATSVAWSVGEEGTRLREPRAPSQVQEVRWCHPCSWKEGSRRRWPRCRSVELFGPRLRRSASLLFRSHRRLVPSVPKRPHHLVRIQVPR